MSVCATPGGGAVPSPRMRARGEGAAPMSLLLDEYRQDFARRVITRGRDLFERGKAKVTKSSPQEVIALVQDERPCVAEVGWDEELDGPFYQCTCTAFEQNGQPC